MFIEIKIPELSSTDIGYILRKNPAHSHVFKYGMLTAAVIYLENSVLFSAEVDAQTYRDLEISNGKNPAWLSSEPYSSNELLASAFTKTFSSTIGGVSKTHQALYEVETMVEFTISGVTLTYADRLFSPLGWEVSIKPFSLDSHFSQWGSSTQGSIELKKKTNLPLAFRQVALLISALSDKTIMWVGQDNITRLEKLGSGWLSTHPEYKLIIKNHLGGFNDLIKSAKNNLGLNEAKTTKPSMGLQEERISTAIRALKDSNTTHVADIGCGEGDLVCAVVRDNFFTSIIGVDPSLRVLKRLESRLEALGISKAKVSFHQGAVNYPDKRLKECQGAVLLEVIEHIDLWRLPMLEKALFSFGFETIFITTPNREFNVIFSDTDNTRHKDHRFEWTRTEFQEWSLAMSKRYGYETTQYDIGAFVEDLGTPTQGMLFQLTNRR